MSYAWMLLVLLWTVANATNIRLLECDPPDTPIGGGYGPKQESYIPGDSIHYYCEADSFIGGNYLRKCLDTGDWTGDTPVCDSPSAFSSTTQTSTADYQSGPESAADGFRETCSSTEGAWKDEWSGTFLAPGQLIRVMLFLPLGHASFEVILVRQNGDEFKCGSHTRNFDRYEWTFQNCAEPHNTGAYGVKIRSLSSEPLRICEIQAYVLSSPKCTDPHMHVENGHLSLSRKTAVLECNEGYRKSRDTKLDCIREGVWNRKNLYCIEPTWTDNEPEVITNTRKPTVTKKPENPDRERERINASSGHDP